MEYENLLNNARWEIVRAISKGKASATELSKATHSSLPNVSQQMKLLEAYDLVEYLKDQKKGQGKPRQLFQLKREFCHLTYARHGFAEKRFFNPDPYHQMLLNVLFVPNLQDHVFLHKYLLIDEIQKTCSVAYLKSTETDIDVFILTDTVDLFRSKYSNLFVEHNGKTKKFIAWSHTSQEVNEGLSRHEPYFENLMHHIIISDPKGHFDKIKKPEKK